MNIAIIGAGIAGLAAAVRLQAKGHQVQVFEANNFAGGKLGQLQQDGYRFDTGPSLFTMPHLVEELFSLANKNMADYFTYSRLDTVCNYFWDDGTRLTAWADSQKYAAEAEAKLGCPAPTLLHALRDSQRKYEATADTFLHKSLHKPSTYLSKDILKVLAATPSLNIFSSMHSVNAKRFGKNSKMTQLFDRYATYNGSSPYLASGILTMIPHLEQNIGAFIPHGGMFAISQSIYKLALELGVQFHFNTPVLEITTQANKATGIKTASQALAFDRVVCNMDIYFAYQKLLPNAKAPTRILAQPKSSSALIFYWGIRHSFPQLNVHNIFFANDYHNEFKTIFQDKSVADDVTIYINITSKQCPDDAPHNAENWFVMVNVPALQPHHDWDALIPRIRQQVIARLNHNLGTDIAPLIATEAILDPRTIQSRTQSHLGALYGSSSNTKMAAFLRHPNFSKQYKNLYFCGGSTHPGGGIPLCLLSAKITADLLQ